jgi:hypothetical protein
MGSPHGSPHPFPAAAFSPPAAAATGAGATVTEVAAEALAEAAAEAAGIGVTDESLAEAAAAYTPQRAITSTHYDHRYQVGLRQLLACHFKSSYIHRSSVQDIDYRPALAPAARDVRPQQQGGALPHHSPLASLDFPSIPNGQRQPMTR